MNATDGIIYGEIQVCNTTFSLNHSIQDIKVIIDLMLEAFFVIIW